MSNLIETFVVEGIQTLRTEQCGGDLAAEFLCAVLSVPRGELYVVEAGPRHTCDPNLERHSDDKESAAARPS